jgi:hypothetical protein
MKKFFAIGLCISLLIGYAYAQDGTTFQIPPSTSAYTYSGTMGETEQLRIYTYIWGRVQKPGLYIVPDDTDLLALLSLAGGPTEDAKLSKIRIVRTGTGGNDNEVMWINLEKYLDSGDMSKIPVLMPGDTVIVSGTTYYAIRRGARFLADIAVVLSIIATYQAIQE